MTMELRFVRKFYLSIFCYNTNDMNNIWVIHIYLIKEHDMIQRNVWIY